jgi:hypothetical protein
MRPQRLVLAPGQEARAAGRVLAVESRVVRRGALRAGLVIAALLLAACGASDVGSRLPPAPQQLPDLPGAAPDAHDISLWLVPGAPRDGRVLELRQLAGCPQLQVLARVTRVPALDDPVLRPEPAVLLASRDAPARSWRLPANAVILGRQGAALLVAQPERGGRVVALAVQPSGAMSPAGALDPARAARLVEPAACPADASVPASFGARAPRCWQVRESPQGVPWLLMQPRACAG